MFNIFSPQKIVMFMR